MFRLRETTQVAADGAFQGPGQASQTETATSITADTEKPGCISPKFQAGLFVFNIMVGSGALALPKIFSHAGLLLSTLFLGLVAALSAHTQHLLLEAQGVAAVLENLRKRSHAETRDKLLSHAVFTSRDTDWAFPAQIASMARILLPPWGEAAWYAIIILYLVPDLAVYSVFVPATVAHVFPGLVISLNSASFWARWAHGSSRTADENLTYFNATATQQNSSSSGVVSLVVSEDGVYNVTLLALAVFATPLTFYSIKKTTALQVGTLATRVAVFGAMTACAVYYAITRDFGPPHESDHDPDGMNEQREVQQMVENLNLVGARSIALQRTQDYWGLGYDNSSNIQPSNSSAMPIAPGNKFHPSHLPDDQGQETEAKLRMWDVTGLPLLFGGAVYAMIAQQYVPSLFSGLGVAVPAHRSGMSAVCASSAGTGAGAMSAAVAVSVFDAGAAAEVQAGPSAAVGGGRQADTGGRQADTGRRRVGHRGWEMDAASSICGIDELPERWAARGIVIRVISCVLALYLVVCWAAVWAYHGLVQPEGGCDARTSHACGLQDLYMFGFGYVRPLLLSRFILLAPLLSMLSSFPLIAITLRDSLILLYQRTRGSVNPGAPTNGIAEDDDAAEIEIEMRPLVSETETAEIRSMVEQGSSRSGGGIHRDNGGGDGAFRAEQHEVQHRKSPGHVGPTSRVIPLSRNGGSGSPPDTPTHPLKHDSTKACTEALGLSDSFDHMTRIGTGASAAQGFQLESRSSAASAAVGMTKGRGEGGSNSTSRSELSRSGRLSAAAEFADRAVSGLVAASTPQPDAANSSFCVRCTAAIVATLPAYCVAAVTRDIDGLVEVTGAFGGAAIMFIVPALLAYRAREIRQRLIAACDEAERGQGRAQKEAAAHVRAVVLHVADATRPPAWQRHQWLLLAPLVFAALCLGVNLWTFV